MRHQGSPAVDERPRVEAVAPRGSGIVSAPIWTRLEGDDFIQVAVTGAPALQLHHLLEFESLYGELIRQAFEKCALLRVARSPAHKGQIRGIGTELVQFFPEVRHGIGPVLDPPRHAVTGCGSTAEHAMSSSLTDY